MCLNAVRNDACASGVVYCVGESLGDKEMFNKAQAALVGLALAALLVSGCGVTLRAGRPAHSSRDALEVQERAAARCIHGPVGQGSSYRGELPGAVTDPELITYLAPFEPNIRRTAVAAGLEPLLAALLRERSLAAEGLGSPNAMLAMRDELSLQMFSLQTQLLAMEFEVDCLRGLITQVLGRYEEDETDRQLALTIASLVVGAGAGVASATWDIANSHTTDPAWNDGPLVVGIVGALATTAIGAVVVVPPPAEIRYVHEHNVLIPLHNRDDTGRLYPTFIFRLLTLPRADGATTPLDALLSTFEELIADTFDEGEQGLAREIIFGVGGVYDSRLLALHQALLDELGGALDALARDVDELGGAIAFVLHDDSLLLPDAE